jgi:hypothetical protein
MPRVPRRCTLAELALISETIIAGRVTICPTTAAAPTARCRQRRWPRALIGCWTSGKRVLAAGPTHSGCRRSGGDGGGSGRADRLDLGLAAVLRVALFSCVFGPRGAPSGMPARRAQACARHQGAADHPAGRQSALVAARRQAGISFGWWRRRRPGHSIWRGQSGACGRGSGGPRRDGRLAGVH